MNKKICVNCGKENNIDEISCTGCYVDFHKQNIKEQSSLEDKNVTKNKILFIHNDFQLTIDDETVIGREGYGKEYLAIYPTISRRHLRVVYKKDEWFILDLDSSNGTYLNDEKIKPNRAYKINQDNLIKLSSKLEFRVVRY